MRRSDSTYRDFDKDLVLGNVIARRTYQDVANPGRRVFVRVGQPIRRKEEGVWVWICPYQIRGIGDDRVNGARGEDSVQVLEAVLSAVRATLKDTGRDLYWGNPEIGIGVAARIPWEFGQEMEEGLVRLVEEEITRRVRSGRKRSI
jgi:hypothetical protein